MFRKTQHRIVENNESNTYHITITYSGPCIRVYKSLYFEVNTPDDLTHIIKHFLEKGEPVPVYQK
jgi:2-phospho-L-lactate guanylyltransferase (CobY/MobA/RfbA family)